MNKYLNMKVESLAEEMQMNKELFLELLIVDQIKRMEGEKQ